MIVHKPVLLVEVLQHLDLSENNDCVDATVGQGGHAALMLREISPGGRLLGFDRDESNLRIAQKRLEAFGDRAILVQDSYANVTNAAKENGFTGFDGILMDLGFSSAHIEEAERGFSFQGDGPLDMRYDRRQPISAESIVNSYTHEELAEIFRKYGEERHARQIAQAIYKARRKDRIVRTGQLADLIASVVPKRGRVHPATRVFQALRIVVNDELGELERALPQLVELLNPGGRLAVISFHSLEDRIVKRFFAAHEQTKIKTLTKKPVTAAREEIKQNPRARSAKLRVAERL